MRRYFPGALSPKLVPHVRIMPFFISQYKLFAHLPGGAKLSVTHTVHPNGTPEASEFKISAFSAFSNEATH